MISGQITLPADDQAPSLARVFATETLRRWNLAGSRDEILLVTSELVANAVRHGKEPVTVRLSCQDRCVRLEVGDGSDTMPTLPDPGSGGFGLFLVDKVCTRWGVTSTRQGKIVWCECPIDDDHIGSVGDRVGDWCRSRAT